MTTQGAQMMAARGEERPVLEWGARLGYAVYGLVYLVLGWLALQVVVGGGSSGSVSRQGALREIARQPLGEALLWVAFAGFCALALWQAADAVAGHRDDDGRKRALGRVGAGAKAVIFAGFAVSTAEVALGSGGGSSTDGWTARLMRLPAGPVLVGVVGLVVVGYGLFSAYTGLSDRWRKQLDPQGRTGDLGTAITVLARTGYTSRGAAFAIIGGLFIWAAFTQDPHKSGGLDQALLRLRDAPLGSVLLVLIAIGLACYGVFNVAKAWHLRRR